MLSKPLNAGAALTDRPISRVGDPIADLRGLAAEQWEEIDPPARADLIQGLDARYKTYVTNFYTLADTCVVRHDYFIRRHKTWRYVAIIGTGLLACLNFLAAKRSIAMAWSSALPIAASLGALLLSVLANLETFGNSAEQAQSYREARELYLDAAQDYDRSWDVAVMALGTTAQAYANAVELYRRILMTDRELRRSFKDKGKPGKV